MKKLWMLLLPALMLWGCGAEPTLEVIGDDYVIATESAAAVWVMWPEEAEAIAEESGENRIYFCDSYTLEIQTMAAGDLDRTLRNVTGFEAEQLTLWQTESDGLTRYECAWSCAGEGGDQVARLVLLDDGAYHYAIRVMADADKAGKLAELWNQVLETVSLGDTAQGLPGKGPGIV